jgi:hypothetical protein
MNIIAVVRAAVPSMMAGLLVGCGLAGTGAASTTAGAASAEQAEQAGQQLERTRDALDAAQKDAADARARAEELSQ